MTSTPLPADGSLLEALMRVRAPDEALGAALRKVGVDVGSLAPKYSAQCWRDVIEVYRAHLHPEVPRDVGHRRLGYAMAAGFGATFTGRLLIATLPMLSPLQLLRRWPRFVRVGRTDVTITITEVNERTVHIASIDPVDVPLEFNSGLLDFCFEKMGERATVSFVSRTGDEVVVAVTW